MTKKTTTASILGRIFSLFTAFATGLIGAVAISTISPMWGIGLAILIGVGSFGAEGIMYWRDVPKA